MTDKHIQRMTGIVASASMNKTRVIEVESLVRHRLYKKYIKVTRRYKAHDEKNEYRVGERVIVEAIRPLSREKRWMIVGRIETGAMRKIEKKPEV